MKPSPSLSNCVNALYNGVDQNSDGRIDYEEFLRVIHPDFGDSTMDQFVYGVNDSTRIHNANFNVDFSVAKGDIMKPTEHKKPKNTLAVRNSNLDVTGGSSNNVLPLRSDNSSNKGLTSNKLQITPKILITEHSSSTLPKVDETKPLEQSTVFKEENKRLLEENSRLRKQLEESQQECHKIRDKYEQTLITQIDRQNNSINELKEEWSDKYESKINMLENKLKDKEDIIESKDKTITHLYAMLETKNNEITNMMHEIEKKKT